MVGSVPVLAKVQTYARDQGLLVQEMHIRGKVHNPENVDLAEELCNLCDRTESLQLPDARGLQTPVRSNKNGESITKGSLTHEVVNTILASRCEWYTLLTELAKDLDLTGRRSHLFATFGIGDCVPLSPFHKLQLRITKFDVLSFISEHVSSAREPSLEDHYAFPKDAVAIIGASCRLPGANSLDELWDLMSEGTSRHVEVPTNRFDLHGSFRASQDWRFAGKKKFYGNFIDRVEDFDHAFFGTNPKEAINMDPQQRILLETAYQAMESSGYLHSHQREAGDPVGCFIGASFVEYLDNTNANPPSAYTSTGTIRAFLCGKLSYYFGWSGPAEVLDTACSSSLVAINRACKAVQTGECTLALTGGVNLMTGINNYLDLAKAGFLSPTGQCKPFDQSADGYCRSEGAGLVVLKMLNQAVTDRDQILGVIPGIATNQGGLSSSITVPSSPAQIKLYKTVLRQAEMKPDHVSYVEAHGTGTQAGDPLEVASVREVFGGADRSNLLHLGSLKGNMGHCETAAGVAGLLKVLAMIKERRIPPQASHSSLNPKIPALGPDKMCIDSKAERWEAPLRAACVNSYGAAGSNAALLCCEGPRRYVETGTDAIDIEQLGSTYPIIVSAASKESLHAYAQSLRRYLQRTVPKPSVGDLAFTLSERRKRHRHRFITTASDIASLTQSLGSDSHISFEAPQKARPVVVAFGGQSKRTVGLEESLYQCHPPLRRYIDSCNDVLIGFGFSSILPSIFQSEPIENLVALHCGTFAMQYASARCWIDAGLEVDVVIGHSFGELTAMAVCGILSLHDGLKLVATRARLMESKWGAERGKMLAIHASPEVVQEVMASLKEAKVGNETEGGKGQPPQLEIACYNAPSSQIVVGSSSSIAQTDELLRNEARFKGIRSQLLDVSHGFHSKFTEPLLADLDRASASLTFSESKIHIETCTADQLHQALPNRPSQHAREPVHFFDAVRRIENRLGPSIWLEAGMNSPIIPMIKKAVAIPDDHFFQAVNVKDAHVPMALLSDVTANLWQQGVTTSYWDFVSPKNSDFKQIWLPPYQFQTTPHWLANVDRVIEAQQKIPEVVPPKIEPKRPAKPLRLVSYQDASGGSASSKHFQIRVATQRFTRIVSGHAVRQRPLCPASMYMECAAMAVQIVQGGLQAGALFFEDLVFQAALGVDLSREVLLTLEESYEKSWTFVIKSAPKADSKPRYVTHGKGRVGLAAPPNLRSYERLISVGMSELAGKPNAEKLKSTRAYGLFAQVVHYAPFLRGISHIIMDGTHAMADIDIPVSDLDTDESTATQFCDTISIDTFIQVVGLLINSSNMVTSEDVFVATGVDSTAMSAKCDLNKCKSWTVYTRFVPSGDSKAVGDIFVLTRDATLVMAIVGVHFTKLLISNLEKFLDSANAKPAKAQITAPQIKVIPSLSTPLSETTSEEGDGLSADTSRATSITSGFDELETFGAPYNEAAESLTSIIVDYTGLATEDVGKDALMSDLGVDSLAAVEFAEELQSRFGSEITPEDLMISSHEALCKLLLPAPSAKVPLPNSKAASSHIQQRAPPAAQPAAKSQGNSTPGNSELRQKVLQLVSESSGAPVDSMHDEASLQDLGVDSLSAVELKGEFEDAFSMEIDDDALTLASTLKEVMEFLGVGQAQETTPPPAVASKPSVDVTGVKTAAQKSAGTGQTSGPALLADPMKALVECEASFDDAADERGFSRYWANVAPKQNELLLAYILEAWKTLKVDLWKISCGEEVPEVQHLPRHKKVMQRLLEILEKHDIIKSQGPGFIRGRKELSSKASGDLHENFLARFPRYGGEARLMALTGPKLADCLTGKADAVSLMFKGSTAQKVMEDYYTRSPMLSTFTEQLVKFVGIVSNKSDTSGGAPIRLFEVGGGFGGTTTRLAEVLQASGVPVEYTFTDIGPTLVKAAKSKFAQYPWMKFQPFNMESDVPPSLKGRYDIIIGTNCVHATTSKTASLSKLRQLLSPDGFIVLSEVTELVDWYDIVFGLLEGWWLAKDGSTYPLQPPESWMLSLKEAGFSSASYSQGPSPESSTQRLLVASQKKVIVPSRNTPAPLKGRGNALVETIVYKEVAGTKILGDIFLPNPNSGKAMPVGMLDNSRL